MKKLYFLVVLMLLMGTSLQAKQIDVKKAQNIAENFFQQQSLTRANSGELRLAYTATDNASATRSASSANLFYVFDRGEANGFIVVAGDDNMRPVLGYTCSGSFDINTANDGLQWWISAITAKAKAVADGTDTSVYSATRSSSAVEPIVKTHWNQSSPYNNLCPVDNTDGNGENSVTGCVATAMAQLLYTCYAGTTQTLSGTVTCRTAAHASSTTTVDLSQFTIDYSKMELTYDGDESDESKNAVATLMYACGLSVNMNYCANGSGSNPSSYGLKKYFGIDEGCELAHRNQYTVDEWDALIRGELDNGRAVLYTGQTLDNKGHAFICDGYNTDGLYHINWGWGGYGDGYFDFCSLDFQYVNLQDAICGIKPGTANLHLSDLLSYAELTSTVTLPVENATTLSYSVVNISCYGADFNGKLAFVLCNSDGSIAKTLYVKNPSYKNGYYYSFKGSFSLPTDLADGTYQLRLAAGASEDDLKVIEGTGSYSYLTLTVSGGSITISGYQPEAAQLSIESYTVEEDGCGYVGSTTPVTLTVKNNGGEFIGIFSVDGTESAKAAIKAGETKQVTVNVTPTAEGEQKFMISAQDDNASESTDLGEITVNVKAASEAASKLVVESAEFQNTNISVEEDGVLAVTLRNDGGKFDGKIYALYGGTFSNGKYKYNMSSASSEILDLEICRGKSTTIYLNMKYQNIMSGIVSGEFTLSSIKTAVYNNGWVYNEIATYTGDDAPSFNVGAEATSIADAPTAGAVSVSAAGNSLIVKGTAGNETIRIYSIGGALVKSVKAEGSSTQIDGLAGGQSYIVSVNGKSVKILVK